MGVPKNNDILSSTGFTGGINKKWLKKARPASMGFLRLYDMP